MIELEAVVSTAADSAQAEILTPEIDTVVWEEVSARTSDDSTLSVSFGVLMVLAGIIAAIAVLTNNPVLIVGATIVSPDYGPMAALSVAVVNRAAGQAWKSFRALAMGSLSEAGKSLLILLVNLAGLLAGGVLTLLGTRVWARRIEAGQAIIRPRPKPGP